MKRLGTTAILLAAFCLGIPVRAQMDSVSPDEELQAAASTGSGSLVRNALSRGAILEGRNGNGWTALHLAAARGHADIVRLLLQKGANIEARGNRGETPLMAAVLSNRVEAVRALLEKGANPQAADSEGNTPLSSASYASPEVMSLLQSRIGSPAPAAATQKSSRTATRGTIDLDSDDTLGARFTIGGTLRFEHLSDLRDPDGEKNRIAGILTRYGAQEVQWVELDKVAFSDVKIGLIPQLLDELKYRADSTAAGGRELVHELVQFGARMDGVYRTAEIRAGLVSTLTIKVTPGARAFYVPGQGLPEQEVGVGPDGTVSISIRPARGQQAVYAHTELGAVKRYIRVDFDSGTPIEVAPEEYYNMTK